MTHTGSTSRIHAGLDGVPEAVDLVVVGLGVTGAGVALDAASRGLSVLAVDAHDVAFGTSRGRASSSTAACATSPRCSSGSRTRARSSAAS